MMNEGCIQYDAPGRLVLMFCYAIEISGLGYIPRQDMKHGIDFAQELPVGWIRRL